MKTKNLAKRLTFNKSTITHLNDSEMHHIYGGVSEWETVCPKTDCTACYTICDICP